ncbi:unnamed protein product [Effrenium voratum]|nr:unnamed protein product [Effrenium voratum]
MAHHPERGKWEARALSSRWAPGFGYLVFMRFCAASPARPKFPALAKPFTIGVLLLLIAADVGVCVPRNGLCPRLKPGATRERSPVHPLRSTMLVLLLSLLPLADSGSCSAGTAYLQLQGNVQRTVQIGGCSAVASELGATDALCSETCGYLAPGQWPCGEGGPCDYQGIKTGGWTFEGSGCVDGACPGADAPLFGQPEGRTDVEGCCWWGRGVIQTTGTCNFGKLNFFMGKRAADENRAAIYPSIDFCKNPNSICDPSSPPELKWVAGMFYWLNAVQPYNSGGWNYKTELKKWVDGGMKMSDTSFINGASGIVNRGCHNPPNCGTGELHAGPERATNFQKEACTGSSEGGEEGCEGTSAPQLPR